MTITIDYDNDCIRMKRVYHHDDIIFKMSGQMSHMESMIKEMINMICDGQDHPPISILKQDDGTITTIEEY